MWCEPAVAWRAPSGNGRPSRLELGKDKEESRRGKRVVRKWNRMSWHCWGYGEEDREKVGKKGRGDENDMEQKCGIGEELKNNLMGGEFNSQQTNIKKKTVTIYNEIRNKATFGCSLSHVGSPQQVALQVFFGRFSSWHKGICVSSQVRQNQAILRLLSKCAIHYTNMEPLLVIM